MIRTSSSHRITLSEITDAAPFALIHNAGRQVAFTRKQYEAARKMARMCRCGACDCCAVAAYVAEQVKA